VLFDIRVWVVIYSVTGYDCITLSRLVSLCDAHIDAAIEYFPVGAIYRESSTHEFIAVERVP
jgi:hypothetical protein